MHSSLLLALLSLASLRLLASAVLAVKRISRAASSVGASRILLLALCPLLAAESSFTPVWFFVFAAHRFFFSALLASISSESASSSDRASRTRSVVDSDFARTHELLAKLTLGVGTETARFDASCLLLLCSPASLIAATPTALWLVTGVTSV